MKTTNTTLRAIFTPAYDRTIGQAYTGNHAGYRVSFLRDGDKLTVEHHGCKGFGPCRPLLESSQHSISAFMKKLNEDLREDGVCVVAADDIPQGFSLAEPAK